MTEPTLQAMQRLMEKMLELSDRYAALLADIEAKHAQVRALTGEYERTVQ